MTTDPFTEAARAEAERRWSRDQGDGHPLPGYARSSRRIGFEIGALWARTHLAAQEPTDAEAEAASRTWAESGPTTAVWEQMTEERREYTRERMRACLSAARAARRDEEKR